ncbi:unnamed protein product [Urochloa decumbens]|uniref:F-box domain-containing protein n=1 Tax=Urochloa decumbens TaxID=240449 RepID=A0ABC9BTE2_9POAL
MEFGTNALPDPAPPSNDTRDWSALPLDAMYLVFTKLDLFDILMGAGLVCHSWLEAAKVPSLWRCVDMAHHRIVEEKLISEETDVLCAMARLAVNRSGGQLKEFSEEKFLTVDLLKYIGDRSPSLKTLRLKHCYLGREGFAEAIKKFPLLEELDLTHCNRVGNRMVSYDSIGKACPHLQIFRQVNEPSAFEEMIYFEYADRDSTRADAEALGIASMPELRTLQLQRSNISNSGLTAILDGCPHLESLDVRQCLCLKIDATMRARLTSLKSLRLPSEPTEDYKQEVIKMPGSDEFDASLRLWSKHFASSYSNFEESFDFEDLNESGDSMVLSSVSFMKGKTFLCTD